MIVIFTVYIFSRIFKKRELSENIYNAKFLCLQYTKLVYTKSAFVIMKRHDAIFIRNIAHHLDINATELPYCPCHILMPL